MTEDQKTIYFTFTRSNSLNSENEALYLKYV